MKMVMATNLQLKRFDMTQIADDKVVVLITLKSDSGIIARVSTAAIHIAL